MQLKRLSPRAPARLALLRPRDRASQRPGPIRREASPDAYAPDRPSTDAAERREEPPPPTDAAEATLEDPTTKRASMEFAAYNDSDHVTVFTPSIALGIENASGASLHATYLVDIVSAASVDIVSTASSRWKEVRHAGTVEAAYKPHDFGVAVGTSVSSEPDYLSYGAHATVTKDFDEKNWTLFFGYGFSHDVIGRCGDYGTCTPFSVFSREPRSGIVQRRRRLRHRPRVARLDHRRRHHRERRPVEALPLHPDVRAGRRPRHREGRVDRPPSTRSASPRGRSSSCRSRDDGSR